MVLELKMVMLHHLDVRNMNYEHDRGVINEKYTRKIPEDAKLLGEHAELSWIELEHAATTLRRVLDNLNQALGK